MDDPGLRELLRHADRGENSIAAVDPAGVAGAVLRRRARRARARAGIAAAILAIVAGGVWHEAFRQPSVPGQQAARVPAVTDTAEPDRHAKESATWLAVARRAEAAERLGRARAATALLRASVESERERAATVMVNQGNWLRERGQDGSAEYRRAAELFDGTRAAAEARARLGQG